MMGAARRGAVEVEGEVWLFVPRGLWRVQRPSPQRLDPGLGELHAAATRSGELWLASKRGVYRFAAGAIGPARGRRLLVELRDQVLQRVNRLYFERLRVLAELAQAPAGERFKLNLRARELVAQLDSWTGGRFSRLRDSTDAPEESGEAADDGRRPSIAPRMGRPRHPRHR